MVLRRRIVTPEEQDVHTSWRRLYAYTARPGVTSAAKRRTRRRERREGKALTQQDQGDNMTATLDARHRDDDQPPDEPPEDTTVNSRVDDGHTTTVDDDTRDGE